MKRWGMILVAGKADLSQAIGAPLMNITNMQFFIKLAECGSLSRAAEALFISHQGLSKIVTAMEDELGCKLVNRGHAGIELTEDGKVFLEYARDIVRRYGDLTDELARRQGMLLSVGTERVRLVATYYVLQVDLMGIVRTKPRLFDEAIIKESVLADVPAEIDRASKNDIFFVHLFDNNYASVTEDPSYVFEELTTTRIGVIWKDKEMLEGLEEVSPSQLSRLPLACMSDNALNEQLERIFSQETLDNIYLKSSRDIMLIDWAYKGRVVSLFDSFAYETASRREDFRRLGLKFTPISGPQALVHVGFLYRKANAPSEMARRFIDDAKQVFAEQGASTDSLLGSLATPRALPWRP